MIDKSGVATPLAAAVFAVTINACSTNHNEGVSMSNQLKTSVQDIRPKKQCCAVVELRQYTLHAGQIDTLIALFDREFVETQEAHGISVLGQFRDLDDSARFVWLRGFSDMPSRADGLTKFYGGPVWQTHRNAANATMIDSDNVLLLRPAGSATGFTLNDAVRAPRDMNENATGTRKGFVSATIYYVDQAEDTAFSNFFSDQIAPVATRAGATIIGTFVSETAANNFPKLPVRENENVFVWFAQFSDAEAHRRYREQLAASPAWRSVAAALQARIKREENLRLAPTRRSLLPITQGTRVIAK